MQNKTAKYLIIGGGIIGCSVAYHLAKNGQKDILLLEKSNLTEGATWHAAGLVGQLRSSRNTTRMLQKSVAMYDRLADEIGAEFDWKKVGSLRLASTKERLLEAKRLKTMARSFNLEMEIITATDAKKLFPYIDDNGLEGAAFIPSDGYVDPASLCQAIATGARKFNAKFEQKTKVFKNALKINGKIKWMVTGTPIQNKWDDVVTLCKLLNFPGTDTAFAKGSSTSIQRDFIQNFMLIRTTKQVKIKMPKLKVEIIKVLIIGNLVRGFFLDDTIG